MVYFKFNRNSINKLFAVMTNDDLTNNVTTLSALGYVDSMLERTLNNRELAITLFEKLFTELPGQINAINDMLENKDYSSAVDICHKLHGSVCFCGFSNIQFHAKSLEASLKKCDPAAGKIHLFNLRHQVNHLILAKNEIINKLKNQ